MMVGSMRGGRRLGYRSSSAGRACDVDAGMTSPALGVRTKLSGREMDS